MKPVIGVMGPSKATKQDLIMANNLGVLLAQNEWVLLNGGIASGVMDAVSEGAASVGGLVVGVLPGGTKEGASKWLSIAVVSGLGSARNNINVLSSDVVVACGTLSVGTLSEVCLAINADKHIILLGKKSELKNQVKKLSKKQISIVETTEAAVRKIKSILEL